MRKKAFFISKNDSGDNHTIYVPATLYKKVHHCRTLAFSTQFASCRIEANPGLKDGVQISADLWDSLRIPDEGTVHLFDHEETLHLGPLIGIFTAGFTGSQLRPVGKRSLYFAKLLSAESVVGGFAFVFGKHHIDWEEGTIRGFFYSKKGWKQLEVPFPHVVYNRLPNRKTENEETFVSLKKKLQSDYLIPWFNPDFFDKWSIHEILSSNPQTDHYMPKTWRNPSDEGITKMLDEYRNVYLKPTNGSLGSGIIQIIHSSRDGAYYCRYRDDSENRLRKYRDLKTCISAHIKDDLRDGYLVQQGITLNKVNGRKFDFRIHTNKDDAGKWKMSAIAVKVAGSGSVTTHLKNGGNIRTLDEIITDKEKRSQILHDLRQAVLTISEVLERSLQGNIGEIGFDVGIDRNDKVWVFEANSKPGRSIFTHPKLKENEQLTRQLPMSYALYLTEKTILNPGMTWNK